MRCTPLVSRALAIGSKERSPASPDVPTVAEAGVPGYEPLSWVGMVAPANTPATTIDTLWTAIDNALQEPAVRNVIVGGGSDIVCS
jgi:tripartite-type tricarboxylate transporter receptor subunit TctC